MRRSLLVVLLGTGCAQVGAIPTGERAVPPLLCQDEFAWSYDRGIASAEGARHPQPIEAPCPPNEKLAATKTAMIDMPASIEGAVRFCVGVDGQTKDVATETATGDTKLDGVLRETVAGWRFRPAELSGRTVEACSTARFVMSFE